MSYKTVIRLLWVVRNPANDFPARLLGYTQFVTAVEGLLIGAKAGIDIATLAQIVPVSASRVFDNIPRAVFSAEFTSGGTLDIVAKDVHLACELAREVLAPCFTGAIADDVFQRAQAQGWGEEGFPMAARILELMAGVELRASGSSYNTGYQQDDPSITTSVQGGMWGDARMAARRLAWERLARSLLSCVSSSHRSNSVDPNRSRGSISRTTR